MSKECSENIPRILRQDFFWAGVLFCCLFLLSYRFLVLWFTLDDTSAMYAATLNSLRLIADRDTYLVFNRTFYTPLLPLSFKIDLTLFGLNPVGYHVHNLLAAFLAGLMGYKLIRLYMPRFEAWLATYLFLLSYPVVTNIGWITRRHYLWGTFFVFVSLYTFKKAEAHSRLVLSLLSTTSYLIALLFKEAFAPFAAAVLLLAEGTAMERIRKAIPYFMVLGGYLVLRFHIIGGVGGYIEAKSAAGAVHLIRKALAHLNLFSTAVWGTSIIFFIPVLTVLFTLSKKAAATFVILLLMTVAPFLLVKPADANPHFLHYFAAKFMLPHFLFSVLFGFIVLAIKNKKTKFLACAGAALLLILQITHAQYTYPDNRESSKQYEQLTLAALEKNREGRNVLVIFGDGIFYNFYREAFSARVQSSSEELGRVITLDDPRDVLALDRVEYDDVNYCYRSGEWIDTDSGNSCLSVPVVNDSLSPPQVKIVQQGQFFTIDVTEERDGEILGVMRTGFSDGNTGLQSALLPRKVKFRIGLAKGNERAFLFYCHRNECSKPIILNPAGG